MTSFSFQTCLTSKELKHREPVFLISYYPGFLPYVGFHNENPLHYSVLHSHKQNRCTLHCAEDVCHTADYT
jgi:hypothetical protein